MAVQICIIAGDGIGGEVLDAAAQVLRQLSPELTLVYAEAGWQTFQEYGEACLIRRSTSPCNRMRSYSVPPARPASPCPATAARLLRYAKRWMSTPISAPLVA